MWVFKWQVGETSVVENTTVALLQDSVEEAALTFGQDQVAAGIG